MICVVMFAMYLILYVCSVYLAWNHVVGIEKLYSVFVVLFGSVNTSNIIQTCGVRVRGVAEGKGVPGGISGVLSRVHNRDYVLLVLCNT